MTAAIVVAVVFIAGVVVAAVRSGPAESPDHFEPHKPSTADERTAADAAVAYLSALQQGRADRACRHAAGRVARQLRCSGHPTIPSEDMRLQPGAPLQVVHIRLHDRGANVWISGIEPAQELDLQRGGSGWSVVAHEPLAASG